MAYGGDRTRSTIDSLQPEYSRRAITGMRGTQHTESRRFGEYPQRIIEDDAFLPALLLALSLPDI